MKQPVKTLEEIAATLETLRRTPATRRRFPKGFWESVIHLTESRSLKEICESLHLDPALVKRKIAAKRIDFCEVSFSPPPSSSVTIELNCDRFSAKIHGPISCIDRLSALLRG